MFNLFAVTLPGLEPYTRQELVQLGIQTPEKLDLTGEPIEESGGIAFDASFTDLFRANLYLRTANRVLARLGEFHASAFSELRKKASRLTWESYLQPGQGVSIRVTCHKSRLHHTAGIAERVAGAIADRLGAESQVVKFDEANEISSQLIIVRMINDNCTVSLDTSDALLHRRGYRLETGKAPLRETLAAGMLLAAGWDPALPLVDPFCGSGTIAIEAALMALGVPPGAHRDFAFMKWPCFDKHKWEGVLAHSLREKKLARPKIQASDRDEGVIQMAINNAKRAGVGENIQYSAQAFSAVEPYQEKGWVITNPPYGVRVDSNRDLRDLYAGFGNVLRKQFSGWRVGILCNNSALIGQMKLEIEKSIPLFNGGIPVRFYLARI
jgi:putative N6-adenine-specific DNA methylase